MILHGVLLTMLVMICISGAALVTWAIKTDCGAKHDGGSQQDDQTPS